MLRPLAEPISLSLRPLWWGSEALSTIIWSLVDFTRNENKLAIENRKLEEENRDLRSRLLAKGQIQKDNNTLRQYCGQKSSDDKFILAKTIFFPNFVPHQTMIVDVGESNATKKIAVGDLAVSLGDVLIGRVAEVGAWTSKVKLLSAEKELAVTIGLSATPALATGSGAGNFSIVLPKGTPVKVGEGVYSPVYNGKLIGVVRYVENIASRPTKTILVKTPVNLWQIEWLKFYGVKI